MGTPVWSHDGIICTGESYKSVVKLTFAKGASLKDPARLFNSSLDGNVRRAIDIHEGEEVDESAFKALVRQAVALNSSGKSKPSKKAEITADAVDRSEIGWWARLFRQSTQGWCRAGWSLFANANRHSKPDPGGADACPEHASGAIAASFCRH